MKIKALKPNGKKKRRGRPRGKLLRGERLVKAARMALAHMGTLSPKTDPINIARLAARLQVTRQAIYDNNLKEVVAEHAELQRKNFATELEATVLRRPLEERITTLEKENQELRRQLDGWIERWVTGGIQCKDARDRCGSDLCANAAATAKDADKMEADNRRLK